MQMTPQTNDRGGNNPLPIRGKFSLRKYLIAQRDILTAQLLDITTTIPDGEQLTQEQLTEWDRLQDKLETIKEIISICENRNRY